MSAFEVRGALVLTVEDLAAMLRTSTRTVHRLNASGKVPRPHRLGGQLRWSREEIAGWVAAGMPDRRAWEPMRESGKRL